MIFDELKYLREDLNIKSKYSLKKDSLLICFSSGSKSHLGKIALVDDNYSNFYFGGFIGEITTSDKIDSKYLFYCLSSESYKYYISKLTDGVNINNLKATDLNAFQIPLPPLSEQKRIVAILDKAFAAIDMAKANAEKNLANAKELFESYLNGIFTNPGDDWEEMKLGEVCDSFEYGSSSKSKKAGRIPVLRMGNIQNGELDWTNLAFTDDQEEISKYLLNKNDVLFNRTNSAELVGKTAIYRNERPAIFAGYLIRIKYDRTTINPHFLNMWLNSKKTREYGFSIMISSVNQANISASKLKQYPIFLPPLTEQKLIVTELDALKAKTKQLESIYQQKLTALDELKKSILKKAFEGKL